MVPNSGAALCIDSTHEDTSAHEHTALFQPRRRKHTFCTYFSTSQFERSFFTVTYRTTSFVIVPGVHISDVYVYWKPVSKKIDKFLKLETMLAFSTQKMDWE